MTVNLATLLPDSDPGVPAHDCLQVLAEEQGWQKDLSDQPLPDAEVTWFTDGSRYLLDGQCKARVAVVHGRRVLWAEPLPTGTSAQKAELIALTKALDLGAGKRINIHTDGRHAFPTTQVHGAIYQQRGLLTPNGKEIKEIKALLEAFLKPLNVSIIHCPGHQKRRDFHS